MRYKFAITGVAVLAVAACGSSRSHPAATQTVQRPAQISAICEAAGLAHGEGESGQRIDNAISSRFTGNAIVKLTPDQVELVIRQVCPQYDPLARGQ